MLRGCALSVGRAEQATRPGSLRRLLASLFAAVVAATVTLLGLGHPAAGTTTTASTVSTYTYDNTAHAVANGRKVMQIGAGSGQVQGGVNGVDYVLGVSRGRIGQFYPRTLP